jgi:hypothetical protein
MTPPLSQVLSAVTGETLEKLAFLFASPLEGPAKADWPELQAVRVAFTGPFCGRLDLGLSAAVLAELAANMLGADDGAQLSADERCDALKELANIVCGNLLPAIGGIAAEFNIEAPRIMPRAGEEPAEAESLLSLENGWCRAALRLQGFPPASPGGRCVAE